MAYRAGDGHVRPDMAKDYKLFAEVLNPAQPAKRQIKWAAQLPFVARSIVLARDALLIAGGQSPTETAANHGPGAFWIASRHDGSMITASTLPAPPVLDGMAMTDHGVFVSAIDGTVTCLRTNNNR